MINRRLPRLAGPALAVACLLSAARGDDKKDPPAKADEVVTGSVADESLAKKAPAAGLVVTKKGWDELVKRWDIRKPFDVDFDTHLVVVATSQGTRLKLTTEVTTAGDLKVKAVGTADLQPGFRYALKRLDRAGIKTVNGKPLPKE